ncbi:MAG: hypothetical protein ACI35W_08095 [Anaeroplasmataceae bacterium]
MSVFKCKHCGCDMEITDGMDIIECPECSAVQIVPEPDFEKKISLYNLANRLRMIGEFSKAESIYVAIANKFEEAEAYFGLCLTKYGVIYNGEDLDCNIICSDSILEDENYIKACELATDAQLDILTIESDLIEQQQQRLKKMADTIGSSDIMILVNDENRKNDSYLIAKEIYEVLKAEGKKVFFPTHALKNLEGENKEVALYKAISSSKLLILFATNPTRLNDKRVIDPLNRYKSYVDIDNKNHRIVPCFQNIPNESLPDAVKGLDIIDLGKDTFIDKILDIVDATFKVAKLSPEEKYLKKALESFEAHDYEDAMKNANLCIKANKKNEKAYEIGLMASFEVDNLEDVINNAYDPIFNNEFYELAISNGVEVLNKVNDSICENIYNNALTMKRDTKEEIDAFVIEISRIKGYKDVNELINNAYDPIYLVKYEEAMDNYNKGISSKFERYLNEAYKQFKEIINYKDSKEMMSKIEADIENLNSDLCDESYQKGIALFKSSKTMEDYKNAQNAFMKVMSYKDSKLWIFQCKDRMYGLAIDIVASSMDKEELEDAMKIIKFIHPYKETAYFYDKAQARIETNDFNPKKRKIKV